MAHINVAERTAQAVSQAMLNKGISTRSLSDVTGIPNTTLRRRLKCVGEFTPSEIFRIADALGCTFMDLVPTDTQDQKVA